MDRIASLNETISLIRVRIFNITCSWLTLSTVVMKKYYAIAAFMGIIPGNIWIFAPNYAEYRSWRWDKAETSVPNRMSIQFVLYEVNYILFKMERVKSCDKKLLWRFCEVKTIGSWKSPTTFTFNIEFCIWVVLISIPFVRPLIRNYNLKLRPFQWVLVFTVHCFSKSAEEGEVWAEL